MNQTKSATKIGIFIPNYNNSQFLGEAIKSILKQSYTSYHITVVDNHSTDGSVALVEKLSRENPGLITIIVNEKNIGMLKNFNKILKLAKQTSSKYIAIFHSDDTHDKDSLKLLVSNAEKNCLDFISGRKLKSEKYSYLDYNTPNYRYTVQKLLEGEYLLFPVFCIRKDFIKKVGLFDKKFNYVFDLDYFVRILLKTKRVGFINKELVKHRRHEGSVSSTFVNNTINKKKILSYYNENGKLIRKYTKHYSTLQGDLKVGMQRFIEHLTFSTIRQAHLVGKKKEAWSGATKLLFHSKSKKYKFLALAEMLFLTLQINKPIDYYRARLKRNT